MKVQLLFLLAGVSCAVAVAAADETSMPMRVDKASTLVHAWLAKPVSASRRLCDMEDLSAWEHHGEGSLDVTDQQAQTGKRCLKLTCRTFTDRPSKSGRPPGACTALFKVAGENWSDFQRLSFWVYPDLPGFHAISMSVVLRNEGTSRVPDEYSRRGRNFFLLENGRWNHVVWEIAHLSRDRVTGVEFVYRMQGHEPGATDTVRYYLDTLDLEKVTPDHYEGWNVAPGRIAYSHTGYSPGGSKLAITSDQTPADFAVLDAGSGAEVKRYPIRTVRTRLGEFRVLDFSELNATGTYVLKAGPLETKPFRIAADVWKGTIWKTINCFYCLRCGAEIAGIHGPCHQDWLAEHHGKTICFNGGWHDAGDLSQGLRNTSEAAYAMLLLAEQLQDRDPPLASRLLREGRWGLDWILKNRFGDGYRCHWGTMDFWTDNTRGTPDDVLAEPARNDAYHNFHAAAAEALAGRLLKPTDGRVAQQALACAREDWQFALDKLPAPNLEVYAIGAVASVELYRSTGEKQYADKAVALADAILACQQQTNPDWDVPLRGFFYRTPARQQIQHYAHIGEHQSPVVALVMLCEALPEHSKAPQWRESVKLYASYIEATAEYTAPYHTFPESVYSLDESGDAKFREQVLNGIRLSGKHYLRCFPVWYDFRGNYGVLLSQARAISAVARLLNEPRLRTLAERQLQWVVGLNPFCQSTMYGEGYDFAPQYTATSGDIVGGLPVGIQSSRNLDAPFWPADNCYNFKEIWVHPSSRWLAIMADLEALAAREERH